MSQHRGGTVVWVATLGLLVAGRLGAATLEACVSAALEGSPNVQAAMARLDAAHGALTEARSAYYPRLGLAGQYGRTDNPPQAFMMSLNQRTLNMADPAFNPNQPDDTQNHRMSITAGYRLFDGGVRGTYTAMARLGAGAADAQLAAVRNDIVHQVTRGYYGVLQAQSFVKVQEEAVQSIEESLRVAGERLKAGSAVRTDVLNLDVKLAETREDLIRARNGVKLAVAALNTAIGSDLVAADGLPVPAERPAVKPPAEPGPEDAAERPELRAARQMTRMREQEHRRAVRENAPVVNLFGSYDWDSEALSDFEDSYMVGVQAEWEAFSGFQNAGRRARARAEWEAARRDEQAARDRLRLDVRQAWLQAADAWERMGVAAKSVESAVESLRITRQRYEQGAADITELLTAQVGLTATRTRDAAVLYDYLIALSNLERARGRLGLREDVTKN